MPVSIYQSYQSGIHCMAARRGLAVPLVSYVDDYIAVTRMRDAERTQEQLIRLLSGVMGFDFNPAKSEVGVTV